MAQHVVNDRGIKTELPHENIIKFHNRDDPDVVLVVDNLHFHCHRNVLSSQSPYFQAMFSRNFAEKNKGVIELKEVDGIAMDAVLSGVYADFLPINNDNSLDLLQTASMLQFNQVEQQCIDFLSRSMGPGTCLRVYQVADRLSIKNLFHKARCYSLWEFSSVKKTESFIDLPINYLESYLSSDLLRSSSEVEVFEAAISWVEGGDGEGNNQTRFELLPQLLSFVRFSSLRPDEIRSFLLYPTVAEHQEASAILKCVLFLMEANTKEEQSSVKEGYCQELLNKDDDVPNKGIDQFDEETLMMSRRLLAAPHRTPPQVPCVVGHISYPRNSVPLQNQNSTPSCRIKVARKDDLSVDLKPYIMYLTEELDESGKKKAELKPFMALTKINFGTTEASGYKVTSMGKDVFILGGQHFVGHGDCIKSMWRFKTFGKLGEGDWYLEGNLLNPRRHHSICALDDNLYLIGGFGRHRVLLDSMERYHVPKGTWHKCKPIPEALYSAASCAFDGSIYVLGSQLYCYHPPSNSWTTISELTLPKNTGFSSAMAYQDWIYLTGIYSTKLMRFNPRHQLHYKKEKNVERELWTLENVGNFRNKALNTCIVGLKIYSFALPEDWQSLESDEPVNHDSKNFLEVETYDIVKQTFEVVWTGGQQEINLDGGRKIVDFMTQHCAGCFSMIKF